MQSLATETDLFREYHTFDSVVTETRARVVETITRKLDTGDYSLDGAEDVVAIERKAGLNELAAMCGRERKRWERCLERMAEMETAMVVIENSSTTFPGYGGISIPQDTNRDNVVERVRI